MNNILISLRKVSLVVTFIILSIIIPTTPSTHTIYNYFIWGLLFVLLILLMKEMLSKKGLNDNWLFNTSSVLAMTFILIVILRSLTDSYIIIGTTKSYKMLFFNNNAVYILVVLISLIVYNILMIGEDKHD